MHMSPASIPPYSYPTTPLASSTYRSQGHGYPLQMNQRSEYAPHPPQRYSYMQSPAGYAYAPASHAFGSRYPQPPSGHLAQHVPAQPPSYYAQQFSPSEGQKPPVAWSRMKRAQAEEERRDEALREHNKYVREMLFEGMLIVLLILAAVLVTYLAVYYMGWGETMRDHGIDYVHQWAESFMIWVKSKL